MALLIPTLEPRPETSPEFKRKKRKRTHEKPAPPFNSSRRMVKRWRTQHEQQIYSSKLFEALRRSRWTSSSSSAASSSSVSAKEVHETANNVLAVSAKGTTRWSRAILTARSLSAGAKMRRHKKAKVPAGAGRKLKKAAVAEIISRQKGKLPDFDRKLKVLGRLVPGCRKLPFSNLLEETSDYIAALKMQVRAMTAITQFLSGGGGGGEQPPADRLGSNVNS